MIKVKENIILRYRLVLLKTLTVKEISHTEVQLYFRFTCSRPKAW